jgi:hypothetical protein
MPAERHYACENFSKKASVKVSSKERVSIYSFENYKLLFSPDIKSN